MIVKKIPAHAIAKLLITEMGLDNGMVNRGRSLEQFLKSVKPELVSDLADAVWAMQKEGAEFTEEAMELISCGDQDEALDVFGKYASYPKLEKVMAEIFNNF